MKGFSFSNHNQSLAFSESLWPDHHSDCALVDERGYLKTAGDERSYGGN